jgi:hypothetical protein
MGANHRAEGHVIDRPLSRIVTAVACFTALAVPDSVIGSTDADEILTLLEVG